MNVFTRRNALVGFVTLKALENRLSRKKRRSRTRRIAAIGIGVLSLGMLAGIAVLLLRRGSGSSDEPGTAESDDEIVGEVVTAAAEPIPAT
jgi:hypothetical protein